MSKTELAVIVPTRGRPKNLARVIAAWGFTGAWEYADLVPVVDADDPEYPNYADMLEQFPELTDQDQLKMMVMPVWMPMVEKLNAAALALAEDGQYFALAFAGDDHVPQTINWVQTYLAKLRELGTGMVYGDDGYQGKKLSTEWAVTTDAVLALGRMVPAPVEHMYCDNSMMDLFDAAGAMRHLPQVQIEHMHPWAGKAEKDPQYERVNHRSQFAKDREAYERWKTAELPSQLAKLRALKPGRPLRPAQKGKKMSGRSPFPSHFKNVQGATPEEIGVTLADFAIGVPADQEIVELGVFRGRTALQMAWGARQGNGAHLTGVDPWDLPGNVYDPPFTDPGSAAWARHWVRSFGFSNDITLIQDFSHNVAANWVLEHGDAKQVGLLYVDGDHTKAGARRDIETWAPHLAEGAIIAIDDYTHPDWPGVGQAVDELVAEGFLAPVEIYHDRLAVTRLAVNPTCDDVTHDHSTSSCRQPRAITTEGVSPSPVPAGKAETYETGRAATVSLDSQVSTDRTIVHAGELGEVPPTTKIEALNLFNLKALAKQRGIVLGARKDKRDLILQALRAGQ